LLARRAAQRKLAETWCVFRQRSEYWRRVPARAHLCLIRSDQTDDSCAGRPGFPVAQPSSRTRRVPICRRDADASAVEIKTRRSRRPPPIRKETFPKCSGFPISN
jgi:hypothetical protein